MFHLAVGGCALVLQKDLEYWGIDELMMEPCCALKYYPEIEICHNEKQVRAAQRSKALSSLVYSVPPYLSINLGSLHLWITSISATSISVSIIKLVMDPFLILARARGINPPLLRRGVDSLPTDPFPRGRSGACLLSLFPQGDLLQKEKEAQREEDENFGDSWVGQTRTWLWKTMEYPWTSKLAQVSKQGLLAPGFRGRVHATIWPALHSF